MCSGRKEKNTTSISWAEDGGGKDFILSSVITLDLDAFIKSSELGSIDKVIRELCSCLFIDHCGVINTM